MGEDKSPGLGARSQASNRLSSVTASEEHRDTPTKPQAAGRINSTLTETPCPPPRARRTLAASSKRHGRRATTQANTTPKSQKKRRCDPEKLASQMVELKLDHWRARARIVHTVSQPAGSTYLDAVVRPEAALEGMKVFDGFQHTWFIPFDDHSLLDRGVAEALYKRKVEIQASLDDKNNGAEIEGALRIIAHEAEHECRVEWDLPKNGDEKSGEPVSWDDVKRYLAANDVIEIVAKHRLSLGNAPLPSYFRLNILNLSTSGAMVSAMQHIPPRVSLGMLLAKLEQWSPHDAQHDEEVIQHVRTKVHHIKDFASDAQGKKVTALVQELEKPYYTLGAKGSERQAWSFKLHVREKLAIRRQGPGNVDSWVPLKSEVSLRLMIDGVRAGKYPTVVRVSWFFTMFGAVLMPWQP